VTTERIWRHHDTEGTIGERVAREIDEAVAVRLAVNPSLARVLDEAREARDHAVRHIVADYLDELDRLAAQFAAKGVDQYDGDGYSVRRLSPDEVRRLGFDADEPTVGAVYDSDDGFQAALDAIPPADAHV